jgi:hypothetical protein
VILEKVKFPKYAEIVTLRLGNGEEKRGQVCPPPPARPSLPPVFSLLLSRVCEREREGARESGLTGVCVWLLN